MKKKLTIFYKNGMKLEQYVNYLHYENGSIFYTMDESPAELVQIPVEIPLENISAFNLETVEVQPKRISLDNGYIFQTAVEVMPEILERNLWDQIVEFMDDETREAVAYELAPCTDLEFLKRYLEIAPADLVIG